MYCSANGTLTIDGRGYFQHFVLRQMTLDTLLTWVEAGTGPGGDRAERCSRRRRSWPGQS